jgi:hypothetical protein
MIKANAISFINLALRSYYNRNIDWTKLHKKYNFTPSGSEGVWGGGWGVPPRAITLSISICAAKISTCFVFLHDIESEI